MEDELDLIIQNMVSAGEPEDNIALVINSYNSEKKKSTPTAIPQKLVLETPTGSSGGVNPSFKSSIPSPIPNFNSMESVKSVVQKPQVKLQKPPEKEETSFFDYLKENLDTGLATVSKSVYDAPGLIYDAAAAITNIPFKLAGVPENELASSDKLAKDLGFRNIPSEILKEKIKVSNEKINEYASKNGGDALAALENGNYSGAAKLVAGTTMQSLPIMVAAMASGGQSTALTAIGVSTASTKNAQLKEENPEMELGTRVLNSANAGVIEAVTGHLFTGASGAVMKKILAEKGVEAGSKIIGKSFRSTIEKSIEKNPLVGAIGEVVEESAVEFGNQVNDMSSGIRTEFDFHAIKNAGLSATGMGGLQTLGVYGAKGYVKAKDYAKLKSTNKEVFKLRNEIDNGNLSPENKAILSLRADRLEAENKKLLGTEIEKAKALPTESKTELNALNAEFEDLKLKFDDIDEADDIPDNLKPALKEEIRLQASKNQKRKTEILSQNDGLEVKDDFSKFEGVEPDFDLENGKISSLPLKEQDRLNKLAVEQITGGDKTIEYTKEQVSQTANEIYKNEQTPPAAEAQPQAEVPQQAEAEKVETPPVEDVVATSVEEIKKLIPNTKIINKNGEPIKVYHGTRSADDFTSFEKGDIGFHFGRKETAKQRGENVLEVYLDIKNPIDIKDNGAFEGQELVDSLYDAKVLNEEEYDYFSNEMSELPEDEIYGYNTDVNKQLRDKIKEKGYDGFTYTNMYEGSAGKSFIALDNSQIIFSESLKNEATPKANTPTNGNVQLGASNVGESGNAKPKSNSKSSVPSSVDGGEVKGDASVGKMPKQGTPVVWNKEKNYRGVDTVETAIGEDVSWKKGGIFSEDAFILEFSDVEGQNATHQGTKRGDLTNAKIEKVYYAPDFWAEDDMAKEELAKMKAKFPDAEFVEIELFNPDADVIVYGKNKQEAKPKKVAVGKKSVPLPILDDIADFINQTYLNDGKQENGQTAKRSDSKQGTTSESIVENSQELQGETGSKEKRLKISQKGKTPLAKRKFKGDRAKANAVEPHDENSLVLQHFVSGGKISSDAVLEILKSDTEVKARNNSFNGIVNKSGKGIDALAHDLWESNSKLSISKIKDAIIDVVTSHNTVQDITNTILKNNDVHNEQSPEYHLVAQEAYYEVKEILKASDEEMQTYEDALGQLTEAEIVELAETQDLAYDDFVKDLESRAVTFDFGPFTDEKGTIQADGSIVNDKGEIFSKESVSNVKQVNPKVEESKSTEEMNLKQQAKDLANAEVDRIAQKLKDLLPGIKDPDLHTQGISQDQLIDLVATAVKKLIGAGIEIDAAIKQVVDSIKAKFGEIDIDIDEIKERINPKKEAEKDFKSKSGKKSLLGRLVEGGNPDVIAKAVKELGENYDVRNQEEANEEAMAFIDKVGASEALKAIKDGLITNSDVKMLIYDEALTRLKTEISDEMDNNPEDREALIQKFQEVSDDFDKAIRDAGQGIAIMNYIYNKNQTLKYNLKKQIADWKRNDPNGEIPADIKAKFEELEKKLKDVEERTKDAEERAKKAEDELAIKNIQEDVERKNQAARKNKSGLTPQEQNRKKQLRDKFARANDVTGIPALLVDPEFREYLGLVLKTAKGDFSNFSNEILKELGKSARQHLPELFANAGGKGDVKVTDLQSITISEEGKIKIPAQLLRDYVEQGYTDIDEIAALIKDDIADEFPDADVRDIRDALTGYGKQINPNKDEITAQVNKLKEYGRLLSAYDDVMNGEMPKKSGLVRPKSEQKARELRRNINRLAKELNLEPVDLESQWANAVDKVKSHLKNQIEDLDKQIANGEKRKVDRTPIKLDEEATALKAIRDAKKQILDDLVGKPELTEEQKIASAEKSLETSIKKIQEEIDTNDIAFKEKPTAVNSKKIEELKAAKKALLETKKQLRQEAGLIEQQRLKTTKTRIKNQIEDLNTRIKNRDFAKKEVKPILADSELNTLRAEKEAIYEEYEKMKYLQELKNRTFAKKLMDEGLEALGLARAIKASLDLGLIGIQLRGFTYSELWRNPKELAHKFIKMFGAIGSQNKTNKAMSELIGHPLHALAKKLDIGMTHPDLRNEVREEMASGNLLHFIWSSPVLAVEALGGKEAMNSKRASIGDSFIDSVKKQYNKLFQNYQVDIKQKEKFSVKEQWKNINAFEAVERGLSIYGNQLRFEEFVRGVDRLKAEGKDEINHLEDYKALASYIRTFSGRAKPAGFELNQKALNVFFFSFKNMASVIQQLNPIYYGLQHTRSTDFKNGNYFKPTVANKMAMATMFKSVVSTSATLLFVIAAYNAFKDDDEEEATIEKDPRSSDFGKLKIGNFRYDPWGGYIPLISLYARLATEEVKKSDGTISKFGEDRFGIQNRGDAASRFLINKESPGFQMFHKYMTSTEEVDKATGETYRATPFGGKLSEEDAYSFYPIFIGSVKSAKEKDYEGVQAFLTAYSILGLGNVQEYESKKGNTLEGKFIEKQEKIKEYNALPQEEKDKVDSNAKIPSLRGAITEQENMKYAIKTKTPYYVKGDSEPIDLSDITIAEIDETIADLKKSIEEMKKEAGDKYKEPKD